MTRSIPAIVTALLLTSIATPVFAQAAIQEPGLYSFYHPNGDLGISSPRASLDAQAMAPRLVMRHAMPMHHRMKMPK